VFYDPYIDDIRGSAAESWHLLTNTLHPAQCGRPGSPRTRAQAGRRRIFPLKREPTPSSQRKHFERLQSWRDPRRPEIITQREYSQMKVWEAGVGLKNRRGRRTRNIWRKTGPLCSGVKLSRHKTLRQRRCESFGKLARKVRKFASSAEDERAWP